MILTECVKKLVRAIGLQLVIIGIVGILESSVVSHKPTAACCKNYPYECSENFPSGSEKIAESTRLNSEKYPCGDYREKENSTHQQRQDGVGLHNVANHLVGIYEVVYGNKIIAHVKLIPEKIFAAGIKVNDKYIHSYDNPEPHCAPGASHGRDKKSQGISYGPESKNYLSYERYDRTVLVEYGIEEAYIYKRAP